MDLEGTDRRMVDAILCHLAEHPQAADTIDGIQRWWLGPEFQDESHLRIASTVETLVSTGHLERRPLPSGGAIYGAPGRSGRIAEPTGPERWRLLWAALGTAAVDDGLRQMLIARYGERHRHYHTMQHIEECLTRFDDLRPLTEHPAEVEVAVWFHDAIYAPRRKDNEERSAEWARASLASAGIDDAASRRVVDLILATRHAALPETADTQVLVDIDLSILGADVARFDEYEAQVRKEYRWVPGLLYRRERARVLREFLVRPRIFSTERIFGELERRARENLERSLARLGG